MKLLEVPPEKLEEIRQRSFLSTQRIRNRIQCFASKFALNRCHEDMHELSKHGVFAIKLCGHASLFSEETYWYFSIDIIPREDMREIRRRDYTLSDFTWYSHLFFEIPVINSLTDEQLVKWQEYCLRTLAKAAIYNKKKAAQWLKLKKLSDDFEDF